MRCPPCTGYATARLANGELSSAFGVSAYFSRTAVVGQYGRNHVYAFHHEPQDQDQERQLLPSLWHYAFLVRVIASREDRHRGVAVSQMRGLPEPTYTVTERKREPGLPAWSLAGITDSRARRLTPPSSGHPPAGCACLRLPLMSNVRRHSTRRCMHRCQRSVKAILALLLGARARLGSYSGLSASLPSLKFSDACGHNALIWLSSTVPHLGLHLLANARPRSVAQIHITLLRQAAAWRRLTPPSSGRSKGRFAPFGPPLMSNVRRHQPDRLCGTQATRHAFLGIAWRSYLRHAPRRQLELAACPFPRSQSSRSSPSSRH